MANKTAIKKTSWLETPVKTPANTEQQKREPKAQADTECSGRKRLAEKSTLPVVSVIDDQEMMDRAKELLAEAMRIKKDQERLKEIQIELAAIASAYDLPGFRFGLFGFEYRGEESTKKTLSKELLIENGVDPEVIGASYKESAPFLDTRFVEFHG